MTTFVYFEEGLNHARMMRHQMATNATVAAKQLVECGQEIHVRATTQCVDARHRLVASRRAQPDG